MVSVVRGEGDCSGGKSDVEVWVRGDGGSEVLSVRVMKIGLSGG